MLTLDRFYSAHYKDQELGISLDYFPGGIVLMTYDDKQWRIIPGMVIAQGDLLIDSIGPDSVTVIPASNSIPCTVSWYKFYRDYLPLIKNGSLRII